MRVDRLLGIIMILLDRGKATAPELARNFETSERTIYRDIESLCMAGVPIQAVSGPGGGYSLAERYTVNRSFFSPDEVLSIMGALGSIGQAAKGGKLSLALEKIQAIGARPDARIPPPALVVSPFPWGDPNAPGSPEAEAIRRAIESRNVISFSYLSMRGPSSAREVEPFTLALGGSVWYLHGYCRLRGGWRLFRVSRMTQLVPTKERFDPARRLPAPPLWEQSWGGEDAFFDIRLKLSPGLRLAALDAFGAQRLTELEDGSMEARFSWIECDPPVRLILGLGPGVTVVEPESLREAVARAAMELASSNGA
jgi:predicted DNA-binding transcriptional regulator YafY